MAENLALEDPHLDAADTVSGVRLRFGIIDVAAQRVQRNATLAVPLEARDLGAAEKLPIKVKVVARLGESLVEEEK